MDLSGIYGARVTWLCNISGTTRTSGYCSRLSGSKFVIYIICIVRTGTNIRLPPRDAAAAAEEERCGDEGFDY